MNRHDLIMNMKKLPKGVDLGRIEKIFSEYEEDLKREKKSGWSFVRPDEKQYEYVNNLTEGNQFISETDIDTDTDFVPSDLTFDYPQRYFDREEFKQEDFYFGNNFKTGGGENQAGIVVSQSVAA